MTVLDPSGYGGSTTRHELFALRLRQERRAAIGSWNATP
ncbi:Hypothetical protein A7982_00401 [Minicystis rosea]|nr:Hypothetical protein A7982_00401 [Minicystis rosea]